MKHSGKKRSRGVKHSGKKRSRGMKRSGKKRSGKRKLSSWAKAVKKARKELGYTGFVPVGGKSSKGKKLHSLAKKLRK